MDSLAAWLRSVRVHFTPPVCGRVWPYPGQAPDRASPRFAHRLRRGWPLQELSEAGLSCTTRLKNAHGTKFRELLYRWHPWHGLRVGVYEAIEKPDGVVFRCALTASDSVRCLEIPAWMFDRSACARVHVAAEPRVDLSALAMLTALLRDVRNNWPAASVAPDSGVSPLSGDQNRREPYAMPQQMEDGTPPRSAADRPVRKGSAGERRHARLVRTTEGNAGGPNQLDDSADPGSRRQIPDRGNGRRP